MRALIIAALLVGCVSVGMAQELADPRFGPEGESRILELTQWMEENPLAEDRKEVFAEVLTWWIEAPHLTLGLCNMLLEGKNKKSRTLVFAQATAGSGAYIIQNRDNSADQFAISMAGVASALKAYETAVGANKKYRDKFYDELVQRWRSGDLADYVTEKLKDCGDDEDGRPN